MNDQLIALIFLVLTVFAGLYLLTYEDETEVGTSKMEDPESDEVIRNTSDKINSFREKTLAKLSSQVNLFRDIIKSNYRIPVCGNCHSSRWVLKKIIGPSDSLTNKIRLKCTGCGSQKTISPFNTVNYNYSGSKFQKSLRELLDSIEIFIQDINYRAYDLNDSVAKVFRKNHYLIDTQTNDYLNQLITKINSGEVEYRVFINKLKISNLFTFRENTAHFESKQSRSTGRHIQSSVKKNVWERDGGKCANCGSDENIHFDHIVPHSKGGSNSEKNVQLLCQRCNLMKSNQIV